MEITSNHNHINNPWQPNAVEFFIFTAMGIPCISFGVFSFLMELRNNNQGELFNVITGDLDLSYALFIVIYPLGIWFFLCLIIYLSLSLIRKKTTPHSKKLKGIKSHTNKPR